MARRLLLLGSAALVLQCTLSVGSAAEEGSCSAAEAAQGTRSDAASARMADEIDGVAKDINRLCPLTDSSLTPYALKLLSIFPHITGTLSMLRLWPSDVYPEDFADEYTIATLTIIGRVLLGLYKARDKSYKYIPTDMLDHDDVIRVENIYAPHFDPDGSPNFYWFEGVVPQFLVRRLYVPLMTCFYSILRKLNAADNSLGGTFDDALNDNHANTWETVLGRGNFKSKRDWVMKFFDIANTWDGVSLWPAQMTDFSTYFKKDEWTDQLEHAIAFHLIGGHRLQAGKWSFQSVAGYENVELPFRIALNGYAGLEVRDGFGRYGVDLYFNEDGLPVLLKTPAGDIVVRGDKMWQYWKFVWRSTLVTGVTLTDHLHFTHFRAANLIARSTRIAFSPDHPIRRVLSIFTFGSIFVNVQAVHVLLGPNHLLHRATPFKNFAKLSNKVPEMLTDITDHPAIKALIDEKTWEELDPRLQRLPFYADGRLLIGAIQRFVEAMFVHIGVCQADGSFDVEWTRFKEELTNETLEAHYHVDELYQKFLDAEKTGPVSCHELKPTLLKRMALYIFMVTAWHRQVGFVGDYFGDPSLCSMSWKEGEAFGRPRQHMIMTVINVFTSTRQPLLKEDYTHLFKGLEPGMEAALVKVWRDFQADLQKVEEEIDRRNKDREILNINMSPKVVESAVSK